MSLEDIEVRQWRLIKTYGLEILNADAKLLNRLYALDAIESQLIQQLQKKHG